MDQYLVHFKPHRARVGPDSRHPVEAHQDGSAHAGERRGASLPVAELGAEPAVGSNALAGRRPGTAHGREVGPEWVKARAAPRPRRDRPGSGGG